MKEVPFSEAKARLSHFVDAAKSGEATVVTRHGKKEAVIVSYDEWKRVAGSRSLWDFILNAPVDGRNIERNRSKMKIIDL